MRDFVRLFAAILIVCGWWMVDAAPAGAGQTAKTVYLFKGETSCKRTKGTFQSCDGFGPQGGLTLVGNTLFGTTFGGGVDGGGTIFSIKLQPSGAEASGYTQLYPFNPQTDGATPQAGLTLVKGKVPADSILYGTASAGGTVDQKVGSGYGTVFSYQPSLPQSHNFKVLHTFGGSYADTPDGAQPMGPLTYYDGFLYGTTAAGGNKGCFANDGCGTVFRIDLSKCADGSGCEEKVIYKFAGSFGADVPDGNNPAGALTIFQGFLYGTTLGGGGLGCFAAEGCGTVFRMSLDQKDYTVLHRFCSDYNNPPDSPGPGQYCLDDGAYPQGALTVSSGNGMSTLLYGATQKGGLGNCGIGGCGTIFSINPAAISNNTSSVQTVFANFVGGVTGASPDGNLATLAAVGATHPLTSHRGLVAATMNGGPGTGPPSTGQSCLTPDIKRPAGTVYELVLTSSSKPALHPLFDFDGEERGGTPQGAFAFFPTSGQRKTLYGETLYGGFCQSGTIYKIDGVDGTNTADAAP